MREQIAKLRATAHSLSELVQKAELEFWVVEELCTDINRMLETADRMERMVG